jgi:hypothetical protein
MRLTAILTTICLLAGCSTNLDSFFEDSTSSSAATLGFSVRTLDNSLPNAMEYIFQDCNDSMVLSDGQEELEPLGYCQGTNYDAVHPAGSPRQQLATILDAPSQLEEPLELSGQSSTTLQSFSFWGIQCSVEITTNVDVEEVALYDLQAWWTTRSGKPALQIDFDFDEGIDAEVSFIRGPVNCTRSWLNRYARSALDVVLGSSHSVSLTAPDLDLWFKVSRGNQSLISVTGNIFNNSTIGLLEVDVEARMRLGTVQSGTVLDALPSEVRSGILAGAGFQAWRHENAIEDGLENALEGVAVQLEDLADSSLGPICSVERVSGELVIRSDSDCVPNIFPSGPPARRR